MKVLPPRAALAPSQPAVGHKHSHTLYALLPLSTPLSYLLVVVLAVVPRVVGLGGFVTSDEANFWMARSATFVSALGSGDFAATAISVHPGVTTMWLGGLGALAVRLLRAWGWLVATPFPLRLAAMQLPLALVNAAGVVLGYALLRRVLPAISALCAAALWATDPFVVGYSRLLHVDGLAGTFSTLALLAAAAFWHHTPRRRLLLLSGGCAALAALSKSPALAVAVVVALAALWQRERGRALLWWGAAALVMALLVWPALWAAPAQALGQLLSGVEAEGARPHELGNFFLGRAYGDDAPGLAFYPVALALRTTPLTLLGLLLLPLTFRTLAPANRRDLALLAGFAVLFVLAMSVFSKKFDRYLVPIFPSLDILAACGLLGLLELSKPRARRGITIAACALVGAFATSNLLSWHPYEIDAFNQLLGGAGAGVSTVRVGWGEGYEQAAAWLNQQPDITGVTVAAANTETLQPYLRTGAQAFAPASDYLPPNTGYVVVYLRDTQAGNPWPPFDRFYGRAPPVYVVTIHGVAFAWIYQVAPAPRRPMAISFGGALHMRGLDVEGTLKPGETLGLRLFWSTTSVSATSYALFIHLIGPNGERYAQADPLLDTAQWAANRYYTTLLALPLPPSLPHGTYRLVVGVYNPKTGERLATPASQAQRSPADGRDAVEIGHIVLP